MCGKERKERLIVSSERGTLTPLHVHGAGLLGGFHIHAALIRPPRSGKDGSGPLNQPAHRFEVVDFYIIEISAKSWKQKQFHAGCSIHQIQPSNANKRYNNLTFELPFVGVAGFNVQLHGGYELHLQVYPIFSVDHDEERGWHENRHIICRRRGNVSNLNKVPPAWTDSISAIISSESSPPRLSGSVETCLLNMTCPVDFTTITYRRWRWTVIWGNAWRYLEVPWQSRTFTLFLGSSRVTAVRQVGISAWSHLTRLPRTLRCCLTFCSWRRWRWAQLSLQHQGVLIWPQGSSLWPEHICSLRGKCRFYHRRWRCGSLPARSRFPDTSAPGSATCPWHRCWKAGSSLHQDEASITHWVFDDERRTIFYTSSCRILPICTVSCCVRTDSRPWEGSRCARCHHTPSLQTNIDIFVLFLNISAVWNTEGLQAGGHESGRIYRLGRSSRSHTAWCTPGCPGGGCRFPDTRCRTPCSACWRGIPFLFHTKHSPGVRSSNGEVSTAKRHDGFAYHTAWVSSRPPAAHRRGRTDVSTQRWWSICTGGLCSCCSTSLWRRPPRRNLHRPASGRPWWRTPAAFSYSVFSAGPDLGLD